MGNEEVGEEHKDKYGEIVEGLKNGRFKNIAFITGAGISTAAGIPDFRSNEGCFANVKKKYNLIFPELLFTLFSFYSHPERFYDFCKEFNIDHCKPTKTHLFMGYLCRKNIVRKIYTQNVDGLELKAGVPENKMVFAHGQITSCGCPNCGRKEDINILKNEYVMKDKIMYCQDCKKPIKPNVIFYGEYLPNNYFENLNEINYCDLAFIIGTSLKVSPFNSLPYNLKKDCWRILINKEKVGAFFASNKFQFDNAFRKDLFLSGKSDEIIDKLVKDCGWEENFNNFSNEFLGKL